MCIVDVNFRDDQRENGRDGLKDECKGKDGEIYNDQDCPAVCFRLFSAVITVSFSTNFIKKALCAGRRGNLFRFPFSSPSDNGL